MRIGRYIYIMCIALVMLVSCTEVSDNAVPAYPVSINLSTAGYWQTYGVHSPGAYRLFVKSDRIPANYPYTANTYTGFGGVMLVSDIYTNTPKAYDLSCPVECKSNVRIAIDEKTYEAVCASCGSRYDVMGGWGTPISGKALTRKVGLSRYSVVQKGAGYNILN